MRPFEGLKMIPEDCIIAREVIKALLEIDKLGKMTGVRRRKLGDLYKRLKT